jgi:hypothetical protein
VVRSGSSDKVIRARLGEEIEGWQVAQIESRRLVLSHDDRSVSFALFDRQKKPPVRDAAPVAAEVEPPAGCALVPCGRPVVKQPYAGVERSIL